MHLCKALLQNPGSHHQASTCVEQSNMSCDTGAQGRTPFPTGQGGFDQWGMEFVPDIFTGIGQLGQMVQEDLRIAFISIRIGLPEILIMSLGGPPLAQWCVRHRIFSLD